MSETEKKGSAWPWILVPVAAVAMFLVLRECRSRLPAPERAPAASVPATPDVPAGDPAPPAPQPEPAAPPPTPQ